MVPLRSFESRALSDNNAMITIENASYSQNIYNSNQIFAKNIKSEIIQVSIEGDAI